MIGNDTQLRRRGFGAIIMRMECEDETEVLLVNAKPSGDEQRQLIKRVLREKARRQPSPVALEVSRLTAAMAARHGCDNRENILAA